MAELAVYVECDHGNCRARSREFWSKGDGEFLLAFCGHHGDKMWATLAAKGFEPIENDPASDDCDSEVVKS